MLIDYLCFYFHFLQATRVKAAHEACNQRMEELNKDYRQQVSRLRQDGWKLDLIV